MTDSCMNMAVGSNRGERTGSTEHGLAQRDAEHTSEQEESREVKGRVREKEIQALKGDLKFVEEYVKANRSRLSRSNLARRDAEISILRAQIAELRKEGRDFADAFYSKANLPRSEKIAQRVAEYFEEIQEVLGIGSESLEREMPQTLQFVEKADGSFEAITSITCNMDPSAKLRQVVDFRFVVPSTRAPVVIAVGPLEQHSFLLLGRKPQATGDDERTYDNRTYPVSEQEGLCDMIKRLATVHSMTLKSSPDKIGVGVYYLSVCTGGGKLANCCVRVYIPTARSPAMDYGWYGIRRQSVNKVAVASARTSWIETKRAIEIKDVSRRAAQGGNRRSECKKSKCNELLTATMDLRVRPIRYLYSRVGTSVDSQTQNTYKISGSTGENSIMQVAEKSEDLWTRLSTPLQSSISLYKPGRDDKLKGKRTRPASAQPNNRRALTWPINEQATGSTVRECNHRDVYLPKDDLTTCNTHGHKKLRPRSAMARRSAWGKSPDFNVGPHDRIPQQYAVPQTHIGSSTSRRPTGGQAEVKSREVVQRPWSARPASVQGSCVPADVSQKRRRPVSALGRVQQEQTSAERDRVPVCCERPGSAMSRISFQETAKDTIFKAHDALDHVHKVSLPSTSVSSSRQALKSAAPAPGGMTAEEQLVSMGKHKTEKILAVLKACLNKAAKSDDEVKKASNSQAGRNFPAKNSKSLGFKGMILSHKEEINDMYVQKVNHGIEYLTKALFQYEETSKERYKLPFVDLFLKVSSGKNIPRTENHCDPYVTISLADSERGQIGKLEKTRTDHFNVNPTWMASFRFDCRDLERDATLTFNCWHHSSFAHVKDVHLGMCTIDLKNLQLNKSEEWILPLQTQFKFSDGLAPKLTIATFFGKEDAYQDWMHKQKEDRKQRERRQALEALDAQEKVKNPSSRRRRHASSEIHGHLSGSPSSPVSRVPKDIVPNDSEMSQSGIIPKDPFLRVDEFGRILNDPSSAADPMAVIDQAPDDTAQNGYSLEQVRTIWSKYNSRSWELLGVGSDVFEFLGELHEQEKGRMLSQTIDFLQMPPSTGSVHLVCPDSETIDLEHISAASDELMLYMAQFRGSHIKRLRMGGCNNISLCAVIAFVGEFRFISCLSLRGHTSVDDTWMGAITKALHLQEIIMADCIRITDAGLLAMVPASAGLRKLDCSHCSQVSDLGILALTCACKALESLNIRGCPKITTNAISDIFSSCHHLAHLDVPGLRAVTAEVFGSAQASLLNLRSLDVSNCKSFDDRALRNISGKLTLDSLTLHANPGVSDVGLEAIASFSNLTRLSLARCDKITDMGLINIARGCRRIQRLLLDFCTRISDTGISFIVDFNQGLEQLSLRGCMLVTDMGVKCVLKHCLWIAALDVAHSGADESEVRAAIVTLQSERKSAQEKDDIPWLVGKKGTSSWTGIEVDSSLLPGPRPIDCEFSMITGGFSACNATEFNAKRDLPKHIVASYLIAEQDRIKLQSRGSGIV